MLSSRGQFCGIIIFSCQHLQRPPSPYSGLGEFLLLLLCCCYLHKQLIMNLFMEKKQQATLERQPIINKVHCTNGIHTKRKSQFLEGSMFKVTLNTAE